jgi:3'-5' exoribonuclease
MNRLFVKDLELGMSIEGQVFLLAEWTVARTKAGSPYLKATLADRTGRLEARYWDIPEYVAEQLETGSGVRVDGVVEEYPQGSGQRQVRIEHLVAVEVREPKDFVPRTKRHPAEMQRELTEVLQRIEDPYLSRLLEGIFSDQEFHATFVEAPAAKAYHHAYIGGLLEHSLAVVRLCSFVSEEHPEIDRDLLLTAAILHDVGKARAYTTGPLLEYTDEGKLVDHIVEGAVMVQSAIEGIEGFPQELRNRLLHAILAHHGARERGSPVEPKTLEALAVHHADWLDGNIRGFLDFAESEPISEDGWTPYSRMFGTHLYAGPGEPSGGVDEEGEIPF